MKKEENIFVPDGSFEYNEETILYRITDDNKPIRGIKGEEKMSRYITFYHNNGQNIGTRSIYGTYDEMSNITDFDAKRWYEEYKRKS